MNKLLFFIVALVFFASCTRSEESFSNQNRSQQDEIDFLKAENLRKDTMVTQSITYFNEIERNLSEIDMQEREIRDAFVKYGQTKVGNKELLLQKIQIMRQLKEDNEEKIVQLQQKVDAMEVARSEFRQLFNKLQSDINEKNKTIEMLQRILDQKDKKYSELYAEYKRQIEINIKQEVINTEMAKEANSVYYCVGTQKELQDNNVINVRKKILRSNELDFKEKFNEAYFVKVEAEAFNELLIDSKSVKLVGNHPENSYKIIREGKKSRLMITEKDSFWKISKYLIIVTD